MGTPAVGHFVSELIPVRVLVTLRAPTRLDMQVVPRPFRSMTAAAANCLVPSVQRKLGLLVLCDGEVRGPEPVLVVTRRTIGDSELASVHVAVAVRASIELQIPIAPCGRKL